MPMVGGVYSNDIGVLGVLVLWLWVVCGWVVGCFVVGFFYFYIFGLVVGVWCLVGGCLGA